MLTSFDFRSNHKLATVVRSYKLSNRTKDRETYLAIEKNDMLKMMEHFDRSNGEVLQQELIVNLIFYFEFRGRETIPLLDKSSCSIQKDSDGRAYYASQS